MYILIEGPDGVGKSTLISALQTYLDITNTACFIDPGISHNDPRFDGWYHLRNFVKTEEMDPFTEMLLFYALRSRLMHEVDIAVEKGFNVIQDRGSISTMVYQGIIKGCPVSELDKFCNFTKPDITFVLDAPFEVLTERLEKRGTNIDKFKSNNEFRHQVWQAYREVIDSPMLHDDYNIVQINADQELVGVLQECITTIKE